jgi:chorismate dehydratase
MHGMQNIDALAAEWARKMPVPESTIRTYLSHNIHYTLDGDCIEGINGFFRAASELSILPSYSLHVSSGTIE